MIWGLAIAGLATAGPISSGPSQPGMLGTIAILLMVPVYLGTIVPFLALTWRRLHDANMSGAFFFLSAIPLAGPFILLALLAQPSNPLGQQFDRR